MYTLYMSEVTMSEAREHLADVLDAAQAGETVYVTRRGRRVAAVISAEDLDHLVSAAEDAADRAGLALARAEDDYVPWEDVKAELGL